MTAIPVYLPEFRQRQVLFSINLSKNHYTFQSTPTGPRISVIPVFLGLDSRSFIFKKSNFFSCVMLILFFVCKIYIRPDSVPDSEISERVPVSVGRSGY